jgi:hypothetical protein
MRKYRAAQHFKLSDGLSNRPDRDRSESWAAAVQVGLGPGLTARRQARGHRPSQARPVFLKGKPVEAQPSKMMSTRGKLWRGKPWRGNHN